MNIFQRGNNNVCSINGVNYVGKNVSISGNKIIIDGVEQKQTLAGPITVTVAGNVDRIETGSGDIYCDDTGDITTASGDVRCGTVVGDINTVSGDVDCEDVGGSVSTVTGDIG